MHVTAPLNSSEAPHLPALKVLPPRFTWEKMREIALASELTDDVEDSVRGDPTRARGGNGTTKNGEYKGPTHCYRHTDPFRATFAVTVYWPSHIATHPVKPVVPLAQWLERRSYEPKVAGSSPAWDMLLACLAPFFGQKTITPRRGKCVLKRKKLVQNF